MLTVHISWEIGTCIPEEILGPTGYLSRKQRRIQSIYLVTDPTCDVALHDARYTGLSTLRHLKTLSWKGVKPADDFAALSETLRYNSKQLEKLELDLIDWDRVIETCDIDEESLGRSFTEEVIGVQPSKTIVLFPSLRILSLSAVSLKPATKELANALNTSTLRSLKLILCPGWDDFLNCIRHSGSSIVLESLEIQCYRMRSDMGEVWTICNFLDAIQGLKDLFISTPAPSHFSDLCRSATEHKSTLRRFVYHERYVDLDDESSTFQEENDLPDMWLRPNDLEELISSNPFNDLELECIGICCIPSILVRSQIYETYARNTSADMWHLFFKRSRSFLRSPQNIT